ETEKERGEREKKESRKREEREKKERRKRVGREQGQYQVSLRDQRSQNDQILSQSRHPVRHSIYTHFFTTSNNCLLNKESQTGFRALYRQ
ncbi:hypothetical protein BgiBS90_014509, partial [Biomphalaria glabrata]